jgi:glycosyltransferase involved in cell wall biosynthesis
MTAPLIDVLIPIYNAAATVESAIASIQRQSVENIRIFAIDDGSTDATARLLAQIARDDERVVVLTQPNGGIVDALNLGLSHTSAPLIARHDADDLADPDRFAQQLQYMESHPECVAVSCFARHIDTDGLPRGTTAVFPSPDLADQSWIPAREPHLLHPFVMVRRDAIVAVGGYHYAHHAEDGDLYWRLQEIGKLHVMPRIMGSYRLSGQSVMSRSLLNGRISAINSQMGAIAANRRRTGRGDLKLFKHTATRMAAAGTSAKIFAIGAEGLSADEARYLRPAFAAKLMELSASRPYQPDREDARFIADALKDGAARMNPENRKSVRRLRGIIAATLLRTGHWRAAWHLLDVSTLPRATMRLIAQLIARALPMNARRSIRSFRGRRHALRPEN